MKAAAKLSAALCLLVTVGACVLAGAPTPSAPPAPPPEPVALSVSEQVLWQAFLSLQQGGSSDLLFVAIEPERCEAAAAFVRTVLRGDIRGVEAAPPAPCLIAWRFRPDRWEDLGQSLTPTPTEEVPQCASPDTTQARTSLESHRPPSTSGAGVVAPGAWL